MIYLTDNDIVEKLAVYDFLDDTLTAYDATKANICVIPSLKFRIGRKSRAKAEKRLGAAAVDRVLDFLEGATEITEYSRPDYLILDDIMDIDAGEAVLLAATSSFPDFRLMTGDKRCIRKLCETPECRSIADRVKGRVICFEQIVLRLIDRFGFPHVLAKVLPLKLGNDMALRVAFGSGIHCTESNTVSCLQGYVDELRGLPMDLLVEAH